MHNTCARVCLCVCVSTLSLSEYLWGSSRCVRQCCIELSCLLCLHRLPAPCACAPRRKFACFAIGNAGFHNPTLYDALRPAVGPLVKLLSDDEEKTRANAAGALGNLVRNSGQLCSEIIKVRCRQT